MNEPRPSPLPHLDLIFLCLAIFGGYVWLQLPWLQSYSLQGFAGGMLIFFGLQFVVQHRGRRPGSTTHELIPLLFALILLTGATGVSQSVFFALYYVLLLLLVLSTDLLTSVIVTSALTFILYALSAQLAVAQWQQLLSLPLMLGFFLYIKYQMKVATTQRAQLADSVWHLETVATQKTILEQFIAGFLKPKLAALSKLGTLPDVAKPLLLKQLDLLETEIDKILARQGAYALDQSKDQTEAQMRDQTKSQTDDPTLDRRPDETPSQMSNPQKQETDTP